MRPGGAGDRGLVLGWGNPGRSDDGLGPRLVEALEQRGGGAEATGTDPGSDPGLDRGFDLEAVFQLSLEHAAEAAEHRWVVFVDAAAEGPEPYEVRELGPGKQGPGEELRDVAGFSTHVMGPEAVLALAQASFGRRPPAWLLAVRGYRFGLGDRLSRRAEANLRAALGWLEGAVSALGRGEQA